MSTTFDLFEDQAQEVKRRASSIPGCTVFLETKQRIVVRCRTRACARELSFQLNDAHYCVEMKPGRIPALGLFYVRVFLNSPF